MSIIVSGTSKRFLCLVFLGFFLSTASCRMISVPYDVSTGALKTTYKAAKYAATATYGTARLTYKIGEITFHVVTAPLEWPMTHDIESIDGISPKDAVRQGRVKNSPYVINGRKYHPLSVAQAEHYKEVGIASWYGYETRRQKGGHMTANGEAFDPRLPTAAHKFLPLPIHVRVTNLANGRSMIVRVNDRGPFVQGRIIDMSAGAAQRLGFYRNGTTKVLVETVHLN